MIFLFSGRIRSKVSYWNLSSSDVWVVPTVSGLLKLGCFVCDFPCKPTDAALTAERVHSVVDCRGTRLTYWQPWGIHMMLRRVGPAAVPDKQPARSLMRNPPGVCLLKWLLNTVTASSDWRNATYGFLWRSVIGCSLKESRGRGSIRAQLTIGETNQQQTLFPLAIVCALAKKK